MSDINNASSNSLLTSLQGSSRPNIVPQGIGSSSGMINNQVNQNSLANINLQQNQQRYSQQSDTRLMSTMNQSIEAASRQITSAIQYQTQVMSQGLGAVAQSISQGFQSMGQLLQQLFKDRAMLVAESENLNAAMAEYSKYTSNFFATLFEKKYRSLLSAVKEPFKGWEDVQEKIVQFMGSSDTLAKILELTPLSKVKNPTELAPFTKDLADSIRNSGKSLQIIEEYQNRLYEGIGYVTQQVFVPQYKLQTNISKQNANIVQYSAEQVKYLSGIYKILFNIYDTAYSNKVKQKAESQKTQLKQLDAAAQPLEIKKKSGQKLTDNEESTLSRLNAGRSRLREDIKSLSPASLKLRDTKPLTKSTSTFLSKAELKPIMDLNASIQKLNITTKEHLDALEKNTSEIKSQTPFSEVLSTFGLTLLNPKTWLSIITGPLGKLAGMYGLYKLADMGIQNYVKPAIKAVSNTNIPGTQQENGLPRTIGSVFASTKKMAKDYIVDPMLTGMKSVFKWLLGEEWFNRIGNYINTIKTYTVDVFHSMFGSADEKADARSRLGMQIHSAVENAIRVAVPVVLKGLLVYRGLKNLANPRGMLEAFRSSGITLPGKILGGKSEDRQILDDIHRSISDQNVEYWYGKDADITRKGNKYIVKTTSKNKWKRRFGIRDKEIYNDSGTALITEDNYQPIDEHAMFYKKLGREDLLQSELTPGQLRDKALLDQRLSAAKQNGFTGLRTYGHAIKETAYGIPVLGKGFKGVGKLFSGVGKSFSFLGKIAGKVSGAFNALLGPIGIIISVFTALSWIKDIVKKFSRDGEDGVMKGVGKFVGNFISSAVHNIGDVIHTAVTGLPDVITGAFKGLWDFVVKDGPKVLKNSLLFLLVDLPMAFLKVVTYPFKWIWQTFKNWWDDKDKKEKKDREKIQKSLGASGNEVGYWQDLGISVLNRLGLSSAENDNDTRVANFAKKVALGQLESVQNVEQLIKSGYIGHLETVAKMTSESGLQGGYERVVESLNNIVYEYKKNKESGEKKFHEWLKEAKELREDQILYSEDFLSYMDEQYKGLSGTLASAIDKKEITDKQVMETYLKKTRELMDKLDPTYRDNLKRKQDEENQRLSAAAKAQADKLAQGQQNQINEGTSGSLGQLAQWFQSGAAQKFIKDSITSLGEKIKAGWEFLKNQDYKKMFGSAMEVFGGVSGSIMSTIFGDDKTNAWLDNALKYAESNNLTYAKKFLSGAKNSLKDNVAKTAVNTERTANALEKMVNGQSPNPFTMGTGSLGGMMVGTSSNTPPTNLGTQQSLTDLASSFVGKSVYGAHYKGLDKSTKVLYRDKEILGKNASGIFGPNIDENGNAIFDCSQFVGYMLYKNGVTKLGNMPIITPKGLIPTSWSMWTALNRSSETRRNSPGELQPGDIVFKISDRPVRDRPKGIPNHVALAVWKDGKVQLAESIGDGTKRGTGGVKIRPLTEVKWLHNPETFAAFSTPLSSRGQSYTPTPDITVNQSNGSNQVNSSGINLPSGNGSTPVSTNGFDFGQHVLNSEGPGIGDKGKSRYGLYYSNYMAYAKSNKYDMSETFRSKILATNGDMTKLRALMYDHSNLNDIARLAKSVAEVKYSQLNGLNLHDLPHPSDYFLMDQNYNGGAGKVIKNAASIYGYNTNDVNKAFAFLKQKGAEDPVKLGAAIASARLMTYYEFSNNPKWEPYPSKKNPRKGWFARTERLAKKFGYSRVGDTFSFTHNGQTIDQSNSLAKTPSVPTPNKEKVKLPTAPQKAQGNNGTSQKLNTPAVDKSLENKEQLPSTPKVTIPPKVVDTEGIQKALKFIDNSIYSNDFNRVMLSQIAGNITLENRMGSIKSYKNVLENINKRNITAKKAKELLTKEELSKEQKGDLEFYIAELTELAKILTVSHGKSDERVVNLTNVITQLQNKQNSTNISQQGTPFMNASRNVGRQFKDRAMKK